LVISQLPSELPSVDIEFLLPVERGVRESIQIALHEGAVPGRASVGSLADGIARQIFEKPSPRPQLPAAIAPMSPQRLRSRAPIHAD
jgi:hypothetical protein